MCSGSVIHAVHTNEMPQMGGLRKKMPYTAYTMLIGCLAIAGAGIPFLIGFSGYYSKDAILEQALSFREQNPSWGSFFFLAAAGGAAITAFYMFRLWYMTFAGQPREQERYDHAHESPKVMYVPLIILSVFAIGIAWRPLSHSPISNEALLGSFLGVVIMGALFLKFGSKQGQDTKHAPDHGHGDHHHEAEDTTQPLKLGLTIAFGVLLVAFLWSFGLGNVTLSSLLEQGRPAGTLPTQTATLISGVWPDEHDSHAPAIMVPATAIASFTAFAGFMLATVFYCWKWLDAGEVKRQFAAAHRFLLNKWWFDELYEIIFIKPTHWISGVISRFDLHCIDWFLNNLAWCTRTFSDAFERLSDQIVVDGLVNGFARLTYDTGIKLRGVQTGRLRQYVMFIGAGTVAVFALASFFWGVGLGR
jgi:NADH:ubiquinone oxidoreductase subunit 5 (subunit L)/multisubunit Na+/H+ antiporter MnhA subunit